jgi:hypothetical protein
LVGIDHPWSASHRPFRSASTSLLIGIDRSGLNHSSALLIGIDLSVGN